MFRKILIANRGEIAVRIIRACREMGIATVAVYSEADREALHTQLADEAVCIGPAAATDSYLNMEQILSACIATKADAIHPGFGFLSENSRFVEMCEKCNITFIGPTAEMMDKMGNKSQARLTMIEAGVPVVPGTKEPVYDAKRGAAMAEDIGYPVMIKASSGGGGKGMRIAFGPDDFEENFQVAQLESVRGFGDNTMYIEKYVQEPRHIEFQIMADKFGNVVQFGERDCSIQRNHQKMIEESPSVALTPELRRRMGDAAVRAAKAVHYESAGTIEFLLDKEKNFYFMEMNTRIQVEHPVTEMVSGVDLMDGTPILDIKPYLPYADSRPSAKEGFTSSGWERMLNVDFPQALLDKVPRRCRTALIEVLRNDPRPSYQNDPERIYGMPFADLDVRFRVADGMLTVIEVNPLKK